MTENEISEGILVLSDMEGREKGGKEEERREGERKGRKQVDGWMNAWTYRWMDQSLYSLKNKSCLLNHCFHSV